MVAWIETLRGWLARVEAQPPVEARESASDPIVETAREILKVAIVAALEEQTGKPLSDDDYLMERFGHVIDTGAAMLRECIVQAELRATDDAQAALHRAEGIDHALADEAIEFARQVGYERRH